MSATEQQLDRQARELLAPLHGVSAVELRARRRAARSWGPLLVGAAGFAALLAVIAVAVAGHRTTQPASPAGAQFIVYAKAGAIYRARADGSHPARIARGRMPALSPDGTRVAFLQGGPHGGRVLVVSSTGGAARRLWTAPPAALVIMLAWAGNRHLVVAPDMGLFSIDVASGRLTTITGDQLSGSGLGVSPDGTRVAWAEAGRGSAGIGIGIGDIAGSPPFRIVHREPSVAPVWGARGIVYSTVGPVWKLWLLDANGRSRRLLHRSRTPLMPVAISADGSRLLADGLDGQVFAVDVPSGHVRALTPARFGLSAVALSRDGQTAYIRTSGCARTGRPGIVVAMPWAGGTQHVVARGTCTVSVH